MKSYLSIIFIFVFSFIVFGQDLPESATFTVTNLNDSGAGSLRQAILDAGTIAGDDTINFANGLSGTITLTSGELVINSNIIINGTDPNTLAVSGNNASRVFSIKANATASINGLTITDGSVIGLEVFGGGIYNAGTLSITNSRISRNNATWAANSYGTVAAGGGIYSTGSLSVVNTTVSGNRAGKCDNCSYGSGNAKGGGIFSIGALSLTNSYITGNRATGAVGLSTGDTVSGGGIVVEGAASITNCAISDNRSYARYSSGGGIVNRGTMTILNSSIAGNSAASSAPSGLAGGGGIVNYGELSITNSTIGFNSVTGGNYNDPYFPRGGGGLYNYSGKVTLRNVTVANNRAGYEGSYGALNCGGIYGQVRAYNTIIASNIATIQTSNNETNSPDVCGSVISDGNNLIGSTAGNSGWTNTDILNQPAKLASLADNGGTTLTFALLPDSPAINAGNNADAPATDQRGFARIVGGIIDIGAFESATTCDFTINPTNQFISSFGGNITVNVTGAASCSRTAVSALEWISVTSGSSGSGNGTVTLSIQANTGSARTGTVTIAGQTFTVNQSSGCTFSLSSTSSALIPSTGGGGTFDIQSGAGCAYTASTTDTWITIDGSVSGTGSGTISYTVAANTGAARTGTITVGGQTFTVNQAAVKSRKRVRFI